ncbi:isochorismatase hydrolase [mine drainage metagenome]|uniref:Isochorismatase hydrolase n=1 Tax=mine drainage metagenome TaxID=410659 RepID=T0ZKS5_9ZZZZ
MEMKASDLSSIMEPENTALVVWDVQNMLVNRIFNKDEFLQRLEKVMEAARKAGIPVFFTKITPLPDRFESQARKMAYKGSFSNIKKEDLELYLKPTDNEIVFNKHTASIFIGTPFELMLNNAGIKNILFAGIATEIGVESSAREASNRGYMPIIIRDCVSSSDKDAHERSLQNLDKMMAISSSEEVISAMAK